MALYGKNYMPPRGRAVDIRLPDEVVAISEQIREWGFAASDGFPFGEHSWRIRVNWVVCSASLFITGLGESRKFLCDIMLGIDGKWAITTGFSSSRIPSMGYFSDPDCLNKIREIIEEILDDARG